MGVFIWTEVFLFVGVFIGYIIGDRLEMQKNEKILKDDSRHTNADRIRNMSDEELAEFLAIHDLGLKGNDLPTLTDWLDWLQSEVKVEESEEK